MKKKEMNYRLTNACISVPVSLFEGMDDKKFQTLLEDLPYLKGNNFYFVFQRELSELKGEHWQCYLEFNRQVYFSELKEDFANSHIEPRKETQFQAINYCKKEKTRISGPYEGGLKKRSRSRRKKENGEIEEKSQNQWIKKIIEKIKGKNFTNFEDIEEEDSTLFWKNQILLKNIWNDINPVNQLDVKPAKVIWCFGEAGSGKSTWTKKMLRDSGWNDRDVVTIVPQNLTGNDKIYFNIAHESKKVLVINEVDHEFPKHNNLIAFIDRNSLLVTRGSHIRNNFELIVINSLYKPENVFKYLEENIASQVLRRIYNPLLGCRVYKIRENKKQIEEATKKRLIFSDAQFQDWYKPLVIEVRREK